MVFFWGADQVVGGWMRALTRFSHGSSQLSASDGTYQPVQPLAWINLSGSDCCFLRMFVLLTAVECSPLATVRVGVFVWEGDMVVNRTVQSNRYHSSSHPFRYWLDGVEIGRKTGVSPAKVCFLRSPLSLSRPIVLLI